MYKDTVNALVIAISCIEETITFNSVYYKKILYIG